MSELLPTLQAASIRHSLTDYLTTTFALTDAGAQSALDDFLSHPETGMFKGPYVRLWLPFRPADADSASVLEWDSGFAPYGHQAAAFARLASVSHGRVRPAPTLVTTGTGSGKTEAFLYPIIDHVLRARRQGVTGMKALILYPMNALANDQAGRLAKLICSHPELATVTAGLYTGQDQKSRHKVTKEGLITDRYAMRDEPPDIMLTNYKMLDQLLLRADDQGIWRASAASLQYLVLDEFHTYDGAQGTDVAMLLRRLGLAIKHFAPSGTLTDDDQARPLGKITPVATSATLGGEDPTRMLVFAQTVFGETFGPDSIITESRQSLSEWVQDAPQRLAAMGVRPLDPQDIRLNEIVSEMRQQADAPNGQRIVELVIAHMFTSISNREFADDRFRDAASVEVALKAHPLVQRLVEATIQAQSLHALPRLVLGPSFTPALAATGRDDDWEAAFNMMIAALGHVRARVGRQAVSVEVHHWLRELTRIDRVADTAAEFRWSDDGPVVAEDAVTGSPQAFPAIYCRRCGRSGWAVKLARVGDDLASDDSTIRRDQFQKSGRVRALIHAPGEADAARGDTPVEGLRWFSVKQRRIISDAPDENDPAYVDGSVLPVLVLTGDTVDADSSNEVCPSCGQPDAIRFLGSAIATLLSVSLSTLFGSPTLDVREKRALVFTDSVQDAAHRAGFVQARAHAMTLRSTLRAALEDGELNLEELVTEAIAQAGDDKDARYRLLPPDCAERKSFKDFWENPTYRAVPQSVRERVKRRMAFDAALEFGLNSRLGRTLELTGSVAARVEAGPALKLAQVAKDAIETAGWQDMLGGEDLSPPVADRQLVAWVRGVLDRVRTQGGINHRWLDKYCQEDGRRYLIWGGRPRNEGMPAFPKGRPAPAFPRVGSLAASAPKGDGLDPVSSAKSWYAVWTGKMLGIPATDAARVVSGLLRQLYKEQVLTETTSASGARVYGIHPANIVLSPISDDALIAGGHMLECSICQALTPGSLDTIDQLEGAPCLAARCHGRLARKPMTEGFYRRMFASFSMRRIVAREHTGLLDDKTRLEYEKGFKKAEAEPQAPNVLVATPTLEMGIDIGDLSAVFLASLPRTVASYIQRVGRAGRLTGNALAITYVTGRGEFLPKLGDPLSVIDGEVRPPATYLSAEEILRRQYTASLIDSLARLPDASHPRKATKALGNCSPGSFLGELIALGEQRGAEFDRFAEAFQMVDQASITMLRAWLEPDSGEGTSPFAQRLVKASQSWHKLVDLLNLRVKRVEDLLPELEKQSESPAATDDDKRALRSAKAVSRLARGRLAHLKGEYWIAVLEEYGILPNYTLLDEISTLDVGMSWTNPESDEIETEHLEFQRGATLALREFAPGAQFYARGLQIRVDAVDLGHDAEAVHPWAMCAACGYAQQLDTTDGDKPPSSCPRCGDGGIADSGQRLEILELVHSTAEIRRDEAMISDRDDERERSRFEVFTIVDLNPEDLGKSWGEEHTHFSSSYYRALTIRWINVGQPPHGSSVTIGGETRPARLFRVCEGCGKLDKDTGLNSPHEHRAWCPYRKQYEEQTRTIALSHTLRTQGLVLRLPQQITLSDQFSLPSLAAAIRLGLREQIGGEPDHLAIVPVAAPQPDNQGTSMALLIHDLVPGGTGYLTDWAAPTKMFDLLVSAWRIVKNCDCRSSARLACHKCLLPFASSWQVSNTSRTAAERHLSALLHVDDANPEPCFERWLLTEDITVDAKSDAESVLEQRFRQALISRFKAASVEEVPGPLGNTARITLGGTTRLWTLRPQPLMEGTRPDFVLEPGDNTTWVVIYTDGWRYHSSQAHNRLADDAKKRAGLRDQGHIVLGVTFDDVTQAEARQSTDPVLDPELVGQVIRQPELQASPKAYQLLGVNPIDWLEAWLNNPDRENITKAARAVPLALAQEAEPASIGKDETLTDVAYRALRGTPAPTRPDDDRTVVVWRRGSLAASIEMLSTGGLAISLVIDDADEALDKQSWRQWLRFSNAMALRDWPTSITTCKLVEEGESGQTIPVEDMTVDTAGLSSAWIGLLATAFSPLERRVLEMLARTGLSMLPVLGEEGPEGIPLDICWPHAKVAIQVERMADQDWVDLERNGWHVLGADDDIIRKLSLAGVH